MIFTQHTISSPLSRYIQKVFHFKGFIPEHPFERVVPSGNINIIFELDGFTRHLMDNISLQPVDEFTKVWISGMHRHFLTISTHKQSEMLVIQFKPGGVFPFSHVPADRLDDKIIPAEEIFGDKILELRENMKGLDSPVEMFLLVDKWLTSRFKGENDPPEPLIEFIKTLQKGSTLNYKKIIKEYPNSQKHLIHQFKKYVGLTPKYFQRILRFNEILQHIQKKEKISWTHVAYSCDYSDQSHFIKEFKHFSGFNPAKFIEMDFHKENTNFFPLEDKG